MLRQTVVHSTLHALRTPPEKLLACPNQPPTSQRAANSGRNHPRQPALPLIRTNSSKQRSSQHECFLKKACDRRRRVRPNAAKLPGNVPGLAVTVIDGRNYPLFQPRPYQVALVGLNPADIAAPIRSLRSHFSNIRVHLEKLTSVDAALRQVAVVGGVAVEFDCLILAGGSNHAHFGHEEWEQVAAGLKSLEQAPHPDRLRRGRDLQRCRFAEKTAHLGGLRRRPNRRGTGRSQRPDEPFHRCQGFTSTDPRMSQVVLIEAAPRVLGAFAGGRQRGCGRRATNPRGDRALGRGGKDIKPRGKPGRPAGCAGAGLCGRRSQRQGVCQQSWQLHSTLYPLPLRQERRILLFERFVKSLLPSSPLG